MRTTNYEQIPENIMKQIIDYVEKGKMPCSFVHALITNNFMKVMLTADEDNIKILKAYAQFIFAELPTGCHGDGNTFDTWILKGGNGRSELSERFLKD